MGSERRAAAAFLVVLGCLAPASASAEATAADRDSARRLMAEGREKRDASDLPGALSSFAAADSIMHVPTTGIELAKTQAALGHLVDARDTALRVAHLAPERHEPPQFALARDAARALSEELAKRIPTLKVVLRGAPLTTETRVTVDDVVVPSAAIVVLRPVDPGHHRLSAQGGTFAGSADVDLGEGDSKEVIVDLVATAPPAAGPPTSNAPSVPQARARIGKPIAIAGMGLAGVGMVVGTIAGIVSLSKTSALKATCQAGRCPPSSASGIDAAGSTATVSNVGFVAAGVGAAVGVVGVVLWSREGKATERADHAPYLSAWIGPEAAGIRGSF